MSLVHNSLCAFISVEKWYKMYCLRMICGISCVLCANYSSVNAGVPYLPYRGFHFWAQLVFVKQYPVCRNKDKSCTRLIHIPDLILHIVVFLVENPQKKRPPSCTHSCLNAILILILSLGNSLEYVAV